MNRLEIEDDCKSGAEVLARAKNARANLWAAKPRPVVRAPTPLPEPPPVPRLVIVAPATAPEPPPRRVPIRTVIKAVSEYFNISVEDILSARRERSCVWPRHVAIYIAWKSAPWGYVAVGRAFAGRDHTTAMSAVRKVEARLNAEDPDTVTAVEIITAVLKAKFPHAFSREEARPASPPPRRSGMPWTDEEKQHVADAVIRDRRSPKEVAWELGRSDQRVRDIARIDFGWRPRGSYQRKITLRRPVSP